MVLCVLDDLLFSVRISTAAKQLAAPIYFERNPDAVLASVRDKHPSLVLIDLNSVKMKPLDVVAALKHDEQLRGIPIVGFVSHTDAATIAAARDAGIDDVLARSAFVNRLPELLTRP